MDRALLAAVLLPIGIFLLYVTRRKTIIWLEEWFWLPGILLLGPLGLGLYWLTEGSDNVQAQKLALPTWRSTLLITTLTVVALICGLWVGEMANTVLGGVDFRLRFLQLYLAVLLIGWILTLPGKRRWRITIPARVLLTNVFWVLVMVFQVLVSERFLSARWAMHALETALGIVVTAPLHFWLMQYGWEVGADSVENRTVGAGLPRLTLAVLLVSSFIAVLGSVALQVQHFSGLPWGTTLEVLLGNFS